MAMMSGFLVAKLEVLFTSLVPSSGQLPTMARLFKVPMQSQRQAMIYQKAGDFRRALASIHRQISI